MRIVNWNIKWGGANKESEIANEIKKIDADLVILTEFKNSDSGTLIMELMQQCGYHYHIRSSNDPKKNGVGIFSKGKLQLANNNFIDKENVCVFKHEGITYFSAFCANEKVTENFIRTIEEMGKQDKTIVIGDINTGPQGLKPNRYHDLDRITKTGYRDIWRENNSEICWSFQFRNLKSQPDHALISEDIYSSSSKVSFDLSPIKNEISDHGIMQITLQWEGNA